MANNPFLNAKEYVGENDMMNYVNYDSISEEHREFLNSATWDFEFTHTPNVVYFPGNDLLKRRMMSVNPQFPVGLGMMTAVIRQFQINQATISGTTSGSISIDYNDREDQAITAWLDDWRDKVGDREHRYVFRKEDTIAHGRLSHLNTSRKPLKIYNILTMQPQDVGMGLNPALTSDDPQNVGMISPTFMFEHFNLIWSNI